MPVSRRPLDRLWTWSVALLALLFVLSLVLMGSIAVTPGDAVLSVLVFGLWEAWLLLLILDWNEVRSLLPPARLKAPWWQGALKVTGYGLAGLFVAGLILSIGESGAQREARQQWHRGAVPAAFVLTPMPPPAIGSLVPPPLPEPARPGPPSPDPAPAEPLPGPPLVAAAAQGQKGDAAEAAPPPDQPPAQQPPAQQPPAQQPPAQQPPAQQPPAQRPPAQQPPAVAADPNHSPCFGKVKVYTTDQGQRLYALPGWPDFLRYAATNWYCSEADAQRAGYRPSQH